MPILSVNISSNSMRGTHLAQTFQNPRTQFLCPNFSLEFPNATEISFCLMRRIPLISSSIRPWWSWSLAVSGLPIHVLSLKAACPNSPFLNCLTQRLTVLTSTHRSPQTACIRLWISVGGNISSVKNSITVRYLNRTSENSPISMCTVWGL